MFFFLKIISFFKKIISIFFLFFLSFFFILTIILFYFFSQENWFENFQTKKILKINDLEFRKDLNLRVEKKEKIKKKIDELYLKYQY